MAETRHEGIIASYKFDRGFGFIQSQDFQQPLFFHYTFLEGVKEGILYNEIYNNPEGISSLRVSFTVFNDDRGLQARQIQIVNPFAELDSFIKSHQALEYNAKDIFFKLLSFLAVCHIDSDPTLTQFVVQRIIKSPQKWNELVVLAKEWAKVREKIGVSPSTNIDSLTSFTKKIVGALKFDAVGEPESYPSIPYTLQHIEKIDSPLRLFREAKNCSVVIFPDVSSLLRAYNTNISLFISTKDALKFIVFLDEKGLEDVKLQDYQRVIILKQTTIIQAITMNEEEYSVILGRNLRDRLSLERIQPYRVGSEYDPSIFSGRAKEREKILEDSSGNFAIYGGRKIGKTWFLKDVCSWCNKREPYSSQYIPFYISLQSAQNPSDAAFLMIEAMEEFTDQVLTEATNPITGLVNTIRKVNKESGKIVLLALDELDDILRKDSSGELFGKMRGLQQTYPGVCKFIFAGFKELIHAFSDEATNNPFAHWIGKNHFPLGCLGEDDLQSLIVAPLKWTGFDFETTTIVKAIFELTSGHPYYTQSLCYSIANARFEKEPLQLNPQKIKNLASDDFFTEVFDIFLANLSALQLLIGKVFSEKNGPFSEQDIVDALRVKFGFEFTQGQIRYEMKILQACSVFIRTSAGYLPVMQTINQEFFKLQNDDELAYYYLRDKS